MKTLFIASALATMAVAANGQTIKYPQAPKDGTVDEYYGVKVADPFRPLEDDTSAATAAWVDAENKVTNAYLAKIPQRAKYLKRLKQMVNYEKVYTPFEKNANGISTRTTVCRTRPCSIRWTVWADRCACFSTPTS